MVTVQYELRPEITEYYDRGGETTRLITSPSGRLEFLRTQDVLRRLIGPDPITVLDVGGATGIHARWLAQDGHTVTLVDPVASQVTTAATIDGVEALHGDARDLPVADDSFDAVFLLGPLYHLSVKEERLAALAEARRVVRPGGLVTAAAIGRFAPWWDAAIEGELTPIMDGFLQEVTSSGRILPREHGYSGFTTAYTHHPDELADEFTESGLSDVAVYALEGAAWLLSSLGDHLDDDDRSMRLLDGLRRMERESSLLGTSAHLLAAAREPG